MAVTAHDVVNAALAGSALKLVPTRGLSQSEVTLLSQWTPGALLTVPKAALQSFTPDAIAARLSPTALAQGWVQDLATAAIVAALA